MKRIIFSLILISALIIPSAWATSPSAVKLTYDDKAKTLFIEVGHITHNQIRHRIREIIVDKNGQELNHFFYPKQETAEGMSQKMHLDAVSGDKITVKAICSEAGYKEEALVIP